jgi:superoxide dismutase, Cu-Zn family
MKAGKIFGMSLIVGLFCLGQAYSQGNQQMTVQMKPPVHNQSAVCVLYPTAGNNVTGTVTFTKTDDGIKIVADLQGLTKGLHGFHIHEYGDCSAPDATSAGGHFNPGMKQHSGQWI